MAVGLYSGVSGLALGIGLYKNVSGLWGGASGLINGFGGSGPFPGASLYLNFLAGAPLDPRITFSRGSNATLVDATGKITYAPANLFTYSQEFDNAAWLKQASTATANSAVAPDGTTTADKLTETATTAQHFTYVAIPVTASTRYTMSVYGKAAERRYLSLHLNNFSAGATFDLQTGTVVGTPVSTGGATSSIISVGNGWYRCIVSGTSGGTATYNNQIGIGLTGNLNSNINANESYAGNGTDGIFIWGAQLEQVTYQTVPGTYNVTTASAYYGPRFDYDPVTLAPKGLLIEEARTNLMTYSEAISTGYAPVRATLVNNATSAPSGVVNATKIVEDTSTNTHIVGGTITSGATASFSVFAKAAERTWLYVVSGTATAYFDLSTGAVGTTANCTGSTVNMGNGWYRCIISNFTTSTSVYVGPATGNGGASYTGNGTSGLYLWGLQLEAGSFATSYIPTVASTVTRSADVATMTGTNFSSWYNQSEGTFVSAFDKYSATSRGVVICAGLTASAGSGTDVAIDGNNDGFVRAFVENAGNVEMLNATLATYTANTPIKGAVAYATNNAVGAAAGNVGTTDTSVVVPTLDALQIGANRNNSLAANVFLNGHIRQIAYYNTRLPNAQLQTLTAPSLATTLSLSFTNQAYTVGV